MFIIRTHEKNWLTFKTRFFKFILENHQTKVQSKPILHKINIYKFIGKNGLFWFVTYIFVKKDCCMSTKALSKKYYSNKKMCTLKFLTSTLSVPSTHGPVYNYFQVC